MLLRRVVQGFLAIAVASVLLALGPAAGAVDNADYGSSPPTTQVVNVLPEEVNAPAAVEATPSGLAITGADLASFAVIGTVLVAGGVATLAARRRTA